MADTENKYVKKITDIAKKAIIANSVQSLEARPTSSATEMKKKFVTPIVNMGEESDGPCLADEVDRVAQEANDAIVGLNTPIICVTGTTDLQYTLKEVHNGWQNPLYINESELSKDASVGDLIYYTGATKDGYSVYIIFEVVGVGDLVSAVTVKTKNYIQLDKYSRDEASTQIDQLREEVDSHISTIESDIDNLEGRMTTAENDIANLEEDMPYVADFSFPMLYATYEELKNNPVLNFEGRVRKPVKVGDHFGTLAMTTDDRTVWVSLIVTEVREEDGYLLKAKVNYFYDYVDGKLVKDVKALNSAIDNLDGRVNTLVKNIAVSLDDTNYRLTIKSLNSLGTTIDTHTVDLPLEEMIVNGKYEDGNIILTLRNGNKISFSVSDLVNGLINTKEKGVANGVASLDANGKVPVEQLPENIGGGIDEETLKDYVKFTDYATASKAGVVYGGQQLGINVNNEGQLNIMRATNEEIDEATNSYKPIVSSNYKYAVKKGITTNTEGWTDEEKAKACETIGAVAKPTFTSGYNRVYGVKNDSYTTMLYDALSISQFSSESDAKRRNGVAVYKDGRLGCAPPESDYETANKKYVDDNFSTIYLHKFPFLNGYIIFYSTQKEKYIEEIDMYGTPSLAPYLNDKIFNATYKVGTRVHVLADMDVAYTDLIIGYIKEGEVERTVGTPDFTSLDDASYTVTKL